MTQAFPRWLAAIALLAALSFAGVASAEGNRKNQPYYSPSYGLYEYGKTWKFPQQKQPQPVVQQRTRYIYVPRYQRFPNYVPVYPPVVRRYNPYRPSYGPYYGPSYGPWW